jgi:hypothetical protein
MTRDARLVTAAMSEPSPGGERLGAKELLSFLGLLGGVAYLAAFMFEAGYLHAFDLPVGLISLNATNIFVAAGAVLYSGLFFLMMAHNMFAVVYFPFQKAFSYMASRALMLAAITFVLSFLVKPWILWIVDVALLTWFARRSKKHAGDAAFWELAPLALQLHFGPSAAILVIALLFGLSVPRYLGSVVANTELYHWVAKNNRHDVLLRVYGDLLVTMPIEDKKNARCYPKDSWLLREPLTCLKPDVQIYKLGDKNTPSFTQPARTLLSVGWIPDPKTDWAYKPLGRVVWFILY